MPRTPLFHLLAPMVFLVLSIPSASSVEAQEIPEGEFNRLALFYAILQSIIAAAAIVVGIGVTFYFYLREQKERRLEVVTRSCEMILWEIADNKKSLTESPHQKISYKIEAAESDHDLKNEIHILYTNAYLYDEAFRSLINSGSFSYFSSNTQYKLASLYGRIRSHNYLITYSDKLQDQVLIAQIHARHNYKLESPEVETGENILFSLRQRYDPTLTKWEQEITGLLEEVENLVNSERPQK